MHVLAFVVIDPNVSRYYLINDLAVGPIWGAKKKFNSKKVQGLRSHEDAKMEKGALGYDPVQIMLSILFASENFAAAESKTLRVNQSYLCM